MNRIDVSFASAGIPLAGHLYLAEAPSDGRRPAIVVGHPGSGVKEQAAGLYARRLAEQGFVTLAFDAAYQGESGGEPRGLEDPAQRVEDFKAAVSYLTRLPEVNGDARADVDVHIDVERIGVLGICASGGYALAAAAGDHRIKAVGTVSAVDITRQFRFGAEGTQDPEVFQAMLDAAADARSIAARGGEPPVLTLFPGTVEEARRIGGDHGAEGFEYYRTPRGEHPRSARVLPWSSVDKMATFDAVAAASLLGERPLLMVVGTRAVTAWMTADAFQRATGPKESFWVEGASHVDLYDQDRPVSLAVDKLADFYRRSLAGTREAGTSEAGTREAGTREAGTSEAGTSEVGTREALA